MPLSRPLTEELTQEHPREREERININLLAFHVLIQYWNIKK
jgi:hypothetical protein